MRAFRIALEKFGATPKQALGGLSGFTADGRWHTRGRYLDYAAQSRSLATLERLVHYKRFDRLAPHVIYELEVPERHIGHVAAFPPGWNAGDLLAAAQAIGDQWCDRATSAALQVPSAITPGEHNLMVNTRHPDWNWKWVVAGPERFTFDARLLDLGR